MTTRRTLIPLALLALLLLSPALRAEDEERGERLSMHLYRIDALVHGRMPFGMQFPPVQEPGQPWEILPTVQTSIPERVWPLGQCDELIELAKCSVLPHYWEETEGADMAAVCGGRALLVRASATVQRAVGRFLMEQERRVLRPITVEVQAVHLTRAQRAALLDGTDGMHVPAERVADHVGPHARVVIENRGQAEAFGGRQVSFVRGQSSEVAESASVAAPIVGVANVGLACVVRPTLLPRADRVRLELTVSLTGEPKMDTEELRDGTTLHKPESALFQVVCDRILQAGTWALLDGSVGTGSGEGWSLLARATPGATEGLPLQTEALDLDVPEEAGGAFEHAMFDVSSLSRPVMPVLGTGSFLRDSRLTEIPQEEFDEPAPPFGPEALVELALHTVGGEAAWEDPASVEIRNGILIVHQRTGLIAAVGTLIDRLQADRPAVVSTEIEAFEVDAQTARWLARDGSPLLDPDAVGAFAKTREAGALQPLAMARVSSTEGAPNTVCSGGEVRYLQTYAVKIASEAHVATPQMARAPTGLEVELTGTPSAGGRAALLEIRLMHTALTMARAESSLGPIDLPTLETARLRTTLTVPFGRTAWIGTTTRSDGRRVVLLATPRLQRRAPPR